jgi:hypothetical protein
MRFHLTGSSRLRPASARTLYCDGSAEAAFRPGVDLELSHWLPNRTPPAYKAPTSTGICLAFAAAVGPAHGFDLVLNNHVDVDGALAMFALLEPELALEHCATLVQAAEMGDFLGWAEGTAARLCQALKLQQQRLEAEGADPVDVHAGSFELVRALLGGARPAEAEAGLRALQRSEAAVADGRVQRDVVGSRFVHYQLPAAWADADLGACLYVPRFDEPLSDRVALWPPARARRDAQRVQLVSVPVAGGWCHDLWLPGYVWADTPGLWRPDGLLLDAEGDGQRLVHPGLRAAADELNRAESRPGHWELADRLSPFGALPGRGFPVVLSFMDGGTPAPSALPAVQVRDRLAPLFAG